MKKKVLIALGVLSVVALTTGGFLGYRAYKSGMSTPDYVTIGDDLLNPSESSSEDGSTDGGSVSSNNSSSVGDLTVGEMVDPKVAEEERVVKKIEEKKPGINWSSGELSAGDYSTMQRIAASLYQDKLNGDSIRYTVEVLPTTTEDLNKFKSDVLYSVDEKGVLTMFMHLKVIDSQGGTDKEVLETIAMRYKEDVVEIVK